MRDRSLDSLREPFKLQVFQLLARLTEAGIAVMIIETGRTEEQHLQDVRDGRSWVKRSLHQDGLAIDLAPYDTYVLHGADKLQWDANDPIWQRMGTIGEAIGMRWGGRWKQRDMGHFEAAIAEPGGATRV